MAACGCGGCVLLPAGCFDLPLRPLQAEREKKDGLHPGSTEQRILTSITLSRPTLVTLQTAHRPTQLMIVYGDTIVVQHSLEMDPLCSTLE